MRNSRLSTTPLAAEEVSLVVLVTRYIFMPIPPLAALSCSTIP